MPGCPSGSCAVQAGSPRYAISDIGYFYTQLVFGGVLAERVQTRRCPCLRVDRHLPFRFAPSPRVCSVCLCAPSGPPCRLAHLFHPARHP
ncbi:hypothetical protein DA2_1616 [Desulfovibrio sp. A2]|nr:hypothetical protein DA2_1616 [Desulfovibrio sp. A2]